MSWAEKVRSGRLKKKLSKYRLAKLVGVSWNTVHMWEKGFYIPKETYKAKLKDILQKKKND